MFRSKRSCLVKRLLRQRVEIGHEASSAVENVDLDPKTVLNMLKRLKEAQLEGLVLAVESRGAEETACVLVPKAELRLGRRYVTPHVLCCQLWRWAEVRQPHELKMLHSCQSVNDSLYICCNPYHWSRLYKPDSPPPPYSKHPQELKSEDQAPSEAVSQETGGTNLYGSIHFSDGGNKHKTSHPWCNIAYWELSSRVGRLFPVSQSTVNVFADLPHGDGLCLGTLAEMCHTTNKSVLQTRKKIGYGVTISREKEQVWVYNKSEYPLFVNSPTLDPPNTVTLTVYRVPPGFSIKIFDYERCAYNKRMQDPSMYHVGPVDPHAVRISFAKGWGQAKYSRQFITSCPCWIEVLFVANR